MKKIVALGAALLLMLGLAACGGSGSSGSGGMADGVYTAEADDAYTEAVGYGWRDTLTVTYKDGKVVDAVFESYDADGNKKSEASDYGMEPSPAVWVPQLSANVRAAGNPDDITAVAGATIASGNAVKLFDAIIGGGKPGQTIQVDLSGE